MLLIDIGTTFVKSYSVSDKKIFISENLQGRYGSDVISRIEFSEKSEQNYNIIAGSLVETIVIHLNFHKIKFKLNNNNFEDLSDIVFIIGNSVMEGFYNGVSLKSLGRRPFRLSKFQSRKNDKMYFLPYIGGFAGSDIYPLIWKLKNSPEKVAIGMDFGTNCEILLKIDDRIHVSSAPAGPAFENISFLAHNIIVDVDFSQSLQFFLAAESKNGDFITPHALIKLLGILLDKKMITSNGQIKNSIIRNNVVIDTERARELLKAKAAVSSTVDILEKYYIKDKSIEKIYIAGNMIGDETVIYMKRLGIIENIKTEVCKELFVEFAEFLNKYINNSNILINSIKKRVFYFPHYNLPDYDEIFIKELYFGEKI
jgi:uncharacterized 2Fe-2S/4Fe-4S cluster protein (DUF4445 family)